MFYFAKFCLWSALIGQSASVYKHRMKRRRCRLSKVYFQCEKCSFSTEKFRNFSFQCEMGLRPRLKMLKFLLYIYHGRLALMGIYASLTAHHLTYIYCIFFLCHTYCFKWQINFSLFLCLSVCLFVL